MLRWAVLALLLANLAYWAWSQGALRALGLGPLPERDPTRQALQVRPEVVRVLPPGGAPAAPRPPEPAATPAVAANCLETEPLGAASIDAAEQALAALLPPSAWARKAQAVPAQHVVVIGPLATRDAVQKKVDELTRLRLAHESIKLPGDRDATHLVLGRYDDPTAAQAALLAFSQKGVRTARVAQAREAGAATRLRVESATAEQAQALRALSLAGLGDAAYSPCAAR